MNRNELTEFEKKYRVRSNARRAEIRLQLDEAVIRHNMQLPDPGRASPAERMSKLMRNTASEPHLGAEVVKARHAFVLRAARVSMVDSKGGL